MTSHNLLHIMRGMTNAQIPDADTLAAMRQMASEPQPQGNGAIAESARFRWAQNRHELKHIDTLIEVRKVLIDAGINEN